MKKVNECASPQGSSGKYILISPKSDASSSLIKSPSRRTRDGKKCRKVYGLEQRDLWCTQCKWKKACSRWVCTAVQKFLTLKACFLFANPLNHDLSFRFFLISHDIPTSTRVTVISDSTPRSQPPPSWLLPHEDSLPIRPTGKHWNCNTAQWEKIH